MKTSTSLCPIALIATLSFACSDEPTADAGDAGMNVPSDASDADSGEIEDAGLGDVGACGCTYGFHSECGAGELCVLAHNEAPFCARETPVSGCTATSSMSASGPCDSQCGVVEAADTPCSDVGFIPLQNAIGYWGGAIRDASEDPGPDPWRMMNPDDFPMPQDGLIDQACINFIGWSALSVAELCGGPNTIRHQEPWDRIENRLMKAMSEPADECQIVARRLCLGRWRDAVSLGANAVGGLDPILTVCPNGLPFAPPCNGPNGLECIKTRLAPLYDVVKR